MVFSHYRPSPKASSPEGHPSSGKEVYSTCLAYPTSGKTLNGPERTGRVTQRSATSKANPDEPSAKRRRLEPHPVVRPSNTLVTPAPTDSGNLFGFRTSKPTPELWQTAKQHLPSVEVIWRKPPATTLERLSSTGSSTFHNSRLPHDLGLAIQTPVAKSSSLQSGHQGRKSWLTQPAPAKDPVGASVRTASRSPETCRPQAPEAARLAGIQHGRVNDIVDRTPEPDPNAYQESCPTAPDEWDGPSVIFESSIADLSSVAAAAIQEGPQAVSPPRKDKAYSVASSDEEEMAQLLRDTECRDAARITPCGQLPKLHGECPSKVGDPDPRLTGWLSDLESDPGLFHDFWKRISSTTKWTGSNCSETLLTAEGGSSRPLGRKTAHDR